MEFTTGTAFTKAGRAVSRDIVTTGEKSRRPVEPMDEAQHIRQGEDGRMIFFATLQNPRGINFLGFLYF